MALADPVFVTELTVHSLSIVLTLLTGYAIYIGDQQAKSSLSLALAGAWAFIAMFDFRTGDYNMVPLDVAMVIMFLAIWYHNNGGGGGKLFTLKSPLPSWAR